MIADSVRIDAYREAIAAALPPDALVLDIGAGTGILTLFACQAGARHVYAVDPNPAIEVAAESVRANGFEDRVTIVRGLSTELQLEQRADLVISDLRGILPYFGHHVAAVNDARERLLKPRGAMIPQSDRFWAAPVSYTGHDWDLMDPWDGARFGLDLSAGARRVLSGWRKGRFSPDDLIAQPATLVELDYTRKVDPGFSADVEWTAERDGLLTGLGAWFDTTLFGGIGFSNAPGLTETLYGRGFFPFPERAAVKTGDRIAARIGAWLVDADYVWRWQATVLRDGAGEIARFDQSTLGAWPLDVQRMHRAEASHVPQRSAEVELDLFVLARIDGRRSLGELAALALAELPGRFADEADALKAVSRVTLRYTT